MPSSRAHGTERVAAAVDTLYVHSAGRMTAQLSKRRVLLVALAVASAVVTTGLSLGFLLHGVTHG